MHQIARRFPVENLREIWPRESDLSDWLVTDDGLALIADDIEVEVEDPKREEGIGNFPCDITGHALGQPAHKIVIENQFGRTDHDHLGKLLTHAAMHSAMTGIWLAEKAADDHRRVIDWLNDNTPPTVAFYLAEIKAYRIGDSPVAPQLDVVCRPNLQTKLEVGDTNREKERHIWRKQFWEDILSYIKQQQPPFRLQSPGTDAWTNIAVGRSDFHISLTLTPKRQCIGCELYMTPLWKDDAFAQLLSQKSGIEAEISEGLQWRQLEGKKAARILLETAIDPRDPSNRDKVKQWMHKQALAFYKTFHDRVKKLQPRAPEPDGVRGE